MKLHYLMHGLLMAGPFLVGITHKAAAQVYATHACQDWQAGTTAGWTGVNLSSLTNQLPGYLDAIDACGVSYMQGPPPGGLTDWKALMPPGGKCVQLCFDLKCFNDGYAPLSSNLNPIIEIGNGGVITAQFVLPTITELDPWKTYCLPIWGAALSGLPANSTGTWSLQGLPPNPTPLQISTAWDTLICNITYIRFYVDNTVNPSDLYGV